LTENNQLPAAAPTELPHDKNMAAHPPSKETTFDNDMVKAKYFSSKIKFKGQCICATKDFFLVSPLLHPDIPPDLYINGITSTRYRGFQEYEISWDAPPLPVVLEKCSLRSFVMKSDVHQMALL
jgi:hypothetical protein